MRSQAKRQGIVWGSLLVVLGVLSLLETFIGLSAWLWVAALALAGLAMYGIYFSDRSNWALLIPAYVLWAIALLVALITSGVLRDEFVATYVLAAIALPFLVVYLRNREQWWALIPTYVLLAIGFMVALTETGVLNDLLVPAYVMFVIAIPFFVVYARDPKRWWALIPAGIMAVIGLSFLIAEAAVQYIGAVALVVVGVWILVRQFARKEPAGEALPPAADEPPAE